MRSTISGLFLLTPLLSVLTLLPQCQAIWPAPRNMTLGTATLFIDQTVAITYNDHRLSYTSGYSPSAGSAFSSLDIVQAAVSRALDAIFHQNIVPWKLRPRGSKFEPDVSSGAGNKTWIRSIDLVSSDTNETFRPLDGSVQELYTLTISEAGEAQISAQTSTGLLRGLDTLVQLFYQHTSGTFWYTQSAPVNISDAPEYPHRGLMLDVARSWLPVRDILRTIDAMSWNKLNRLHIHMTDSQSWPIEIPALPELSAEGAYASGMVYTAEDLAEIQEYAVRRGIEPVIEIDMPGHLGSVALSHPELIVAYNQMPYQYYCAEPPCGAFKLNDSAVYDLLEKLWDDLLPRVAPYSAYFHSGGDELNANDSMLDEGVRSNDTEVLRPLLQKFIDTAHGRIRGAGLTPIVWEEMVTQWNISLGKDVVVQSWLGGDAVKTLAEAGHKVLDSNYEFWYLDCGRGQWLDFQDEPAWYPFNDWCQPFKNWRMMYTHDPGAGVAADARANVLGGVAALWTEMADTANLDSLVWPRVGAVAEVLWSGRLDGEGKNRTQFDASPRLAEMRERMVARGVGASPLQPIFCTQNDPRLCSI